MARYRVTQARLYFKGYAKNITFDAYTNDVEKLREVLKEKHGATVVVLKYKEV